MALDLAIAQERILATRPYASRIAEMMQRVARHTDPSLSPLLQVPDHCEREALVVIGADRGLCGGLNMNLFKLVLGSIQEWQAKGAEVSLWLGCTEAFAPHLLRHTYVVGGEGRTLVTVTSCCAWSSMTCL